MSRTRYFTLRYKRSPLVLVGSDGGLMEKSRTVDEIKLVPAERHDFVFTPPDAPGSEAMFKWYPTDRGFGSTYNRLAEDIMKIKTVNEPRVEPEPVPEKLRTIAAIDTKGAKEREMNLTIGYDRDENVSMGINGVNYKDAMPIMAKVGATEVWTIRNDTDFNHPFHLHGFFFQEVTPANGILQWKDTIDVPQHTQKKIVVKFDNRPGMWMYHCHILDHADVGMMGHLHLME
jgi:FtsP/CotA-like multicopper oxidase with cupredoxin domain